MAKKIVSGKNGKPDSSSVTGKVSTGGSIVIPELEAAAARVAKSTFTAKDHEIIRVYKDRVRLYTLASYLKKAPGTVRRYISANF